MLEEEGEERSVVAAAAGKTVVETSLRLRYFGLCGVDDTVGDPELLYLISLKYPKIEWGVLFRPDKEGEPRYATKKWVQRLTETPKSRKMNLAGHLCGSRCREVLEGDASFVRSLAKLGFKRVQVNATKANGVDSSELSKRVESFRSAVLAVPEIEWILQMNKETEALWKPFEKHAGTSSCPKNISLLFDASCGMGILPSSFAPPHPVLSCGYAGGLGPKNIAAVLKKIENVVSASKDSTKKHPGVWTDMESSLREKRDGADCFSVHKAFRCAALAAEFGAIEASGV
eukprot:g3851.t1